MTSNELTRLFMLALCIWREARGETLQGKRLVASVIRNRVEDPKRWPNTYVGVITQPWQFSSFNANDPNSAKFPEDGTDAFGPWNECVAAATAVLESDVPFTTANHYHTVNVSPKWRDDTKIVAREGHHIFYKL